MISLLEEHEILDLVFQFGGGLVPGSIRDQMVRAQLAAEALPYMLQARGLPASELRVLVVGAGAAGATAAIRLAEIGFDTTLVEATPISFPLQYGCFTRWLDPTLYDWPAVHSAEGWYAHELPPFPVPIPWGRQWSYTLPADGAMHLGIADARLPNLHVLPSHIAIPRVYAWFSGIVPVSMWELINLDDGTRTVEPFNVVFWTVGYGLERSECDNNYSGFSFWDTDPLAIANCALPAPPNIVISGSGDGALQDFLRIVFEGRLTGTLLNDLNLPNLVRHELREAEDAATRSFHWSEDNTGRDHFILSALHLRHVEIVDRLLDVDTFRDLVGEMLPNPFPQIKLVFSCSHFSNCYALNRFLVVLVTRYLQRFGGRADILVPYRRLTRVEGTIHACNNDPIACHGEDHTVELRRSFGCWTDALGPPDELFVAQVVVVRHGTDFVYRHLFPRIRKPRQVLPYLPT